MVFKQHLLFFVWIYAYGSMTQPTLCETSFCTSSDLQYAVQDLLP